jgi:hypothetical protein
VDKAVKDGIVKPGQYLILEFDFSRVARPYKIDESTESLKKEINRGLSLFKILYAKDLGEVFVSNTSDFTQNDPTENLADLVLAAGAALKGIHERGEEGHALWGVRGVCSF